MNKPKLFPTTDLFKITNVPTITQLYMESATIAIFKRKHLLKQHNHTQNTRYRALNPLAIEKLNKTKTQQEATNIGIKIYNSLPI